MRGYAVIDTEGTGVFDYRRPANDVGQPRMAALSILRCSPDLEVIEREYHVLIKPDGWTLSAEAAAVNKLTMERLQAEGVPVRDTLEEFRLAVQQEWRVVIAHNAQHDLKQVRAEFRRAGLPDLFMITRNICTMRNLGHDLVPKASGKKGWPKLEEAAAHFGVVAPDHTARGDSVSCLGVARHMLRLGILGKGEIHRTSRKIEPAPAMPGGLGAALKESVAEGKAGREDW